MVEIETTSGELRKMPRFNALSRSSKKLKRVSRSSFAAECLSAYSAGDLWRELTGDATGCFIITSVEYPIV